jgi:hypothetical protein
MSRRRPKNRAKRARRERRIAIEEAAKTSVLVSPGSGKSISPIIEKPEVQVAIAPAFVQDPVHIYVDGQWHIVEAASHHFPITINNVKVEPKWAANVLAKRNGRNRPKKPAAISRYIQEIENGNWETTHEGIGFYTTGDLADGQNRLWAVVECTLPIITHMTFGIDPSAGVVINEGATRSAADSARIQGIAEASPKRISISNYILEIRFNKRNIPRHQQIEFFKVHLDAILFADQLQAPRVSKAPVKAVIMRAYYHEDRAELQRFMKILSTGVVSDIADQAANRLREFALTHIGNSGGERHVLYRKTESALLAFLQGKPLTKLYECKEEQWPLANED